MKTVASFILKFIALIGGLFVALIVLLILLILGMAGAADMLIN